MLIAYFVGTVIELLLIDHFSNLENVTLEAKVEADHVPR